jgi:hypothetical protein
MNEDDAGGVALRIDFASKASVMDVTHFLAAEIAAYRGSITLM